MLDKLFKDPTKKFVATLPDAKEPEVEFAPVMVDKEETEETPVSEVSTDEATSTTTTEKKEAAPAPVTVASSASVRDLITSAVKEASPATDESGNVITETKQEPTFAEAYLVNAGNKNGRRRPGKSMAPFMDIAGNMRTGG